MKAGKILDGCAPDHGALARIDHFELKSDLGDGTYLARDLASGRDVVVSASAGPNARLHDVRVADYWDLTVKKRLAVFPGGILHVADADAATEPKTDFRAERPETFGASGALKPAATTCPGRRKKPFFAILLIALLIAIPVALMIFRGKEISPSAQADVVISVNGHELTRNQLDADVEKFVKAQGDKIPAEQLENAKRTVKERLVQNFIMEKVFAARAKASGIAVTDADRRAREKAFLAEAAKTPDGPKSLDEHFRNFPWGEVRARAEFENGILVDKMIKAEWAKAPKKDFAAEAKRIIGQIVSNNTLVAKTNADALQKIKALKRQLDETPRASLLAKFAELARENSVCPSSAQGGDLGEFARGQMVKEFDDVAFSLPLNTVSDPVLTKFGYHLVLVTKKIPATQAADGQPAAPEKVRASHILIKAQCVQDVPTPDDVVKLLEKNEERAFVKKYLREQVKRAKIVVADEFKHLVPSDEQGQDADESPSAAKTED